mmetsp:Transcript_76318/g.241341  ORF Transcript_76318/g.241341 Transcript_76318/m.241341 type:complete len:413 (+) Transcript_76318:189-1427(+)
MFLIAPGKPQLKTQVNAPRAWKHRVRCSRIHTSSRPPHLFLLHLLPVGMVVSGIQSLGMAVQVSKVNPKVLRQPPSATMPEGVPVCRLLRRSGPCSWRESYKKRRQRGSSSSTSSTSQVDDLGPKPGHAGAERPSPPEELAGPGRLSPPEVRDGDALNDAAEDRAASRRAGRDDDDAKFVPGDFMEFLAEREFFRETLDCLPPRSSPSPAPHGSASGRRRPPSSTPLGGAAAPGAAAGALGTGTAVGSRVASAGKARRTAIVLEELWQVDDVIPRAPRTRQSSQAVSRQADKSRQTATRKPSPGRSRKPWILPELVSTSAAPMVEELPSIVERNMKISFRDTSPSRSRSRSASPNRGPRGGPGAALDVGEQRRSRSPEQDRCRPLWTTKSGPGGGVPARGRGYLPQKAASAR